MKKLSRILLTVFLFCQIFGGISLTAKADTAFSAEIVVQGIDGTIASGKTTKSNAKEALEEVLGSKGISIDTPESSFGGKYIKTIGNLSEKHFKGYDGWMYIIYSANKYETPFTSIDTTILKNGDKLIVYYGNYGTTMVLNDIEFSTKEPLKELTISLNNITNDYNTKKDITTPISNIKVKIDGKEIVLNENKILIKEGLALGKHIIAFEGYSDKGVPLVVADTIEFTIDGSVASDNKPTTTNVNSIDNTKNSIDIDNDVKLTSDFIKSKPVDTWSAVSLSKLGISFDSKFIDEKAQEIQKDGVKEVSNTDLEKLIIGLVVSGYKYDEFLGYDLAKELYNRDPSTFLINDTIFGLIAYKYANIDGDYKITYNNLKDMLLSQKLSYKSNNIDISGWTYFGDKIDPDLTGIAICALSDFYDKDLATKAAIDGVVNSLSSIQDESGYIAGPFGVSSESLSFTILGLTSIGINPEGKLFSKKNGNLVSALLSFKGSNGMYKHELKGTDDAMSTEQILRSLIALKEFKANNKYDYYKNTINKNSLVEYKAIKTLPKTGSPIDMISTIGIGSIMIILGLFLIKKKEYEI